jgi:hypothetical protein
MLTPESRLLRFELSHLVSRASRTIPVSVVRTTPMKKAAIPTIAMLQTPGRVRRVIASLLAPITVAIESFYKTTFSGGARADCRS